MLEAGAGFGAQLDQVAGADVLAKAEAGGPGERDPGVTVLGLVGGPVGHALERAARPVGVESGGAVDEGRDAARRPGEFRSEAELKTPVLGLDLELVARPHVAG